MQESTWIVKIDKQVFHLTEEEMDLLDKAMASGQSRVRFENFVLSVPHIAYVVRDSELDRIKLLNNPLLNDGEFMEMKQTENVERQLRLQEKLEDRYPLPRYQQAWDEAKKNWKKLVKTAS